MEYDPAYTEEDVRDIASELLKLVDRNTHAFDRREFREHRDVQFDEQMGLWLNEYRTGTSSESSEGRDVNSEGRELNSDVEELLDRMETEDVLRALNREIALQESSGTRTTKVDRWQERIVNGDAELEDVDVGKVSEGADMSRTSFYKLRDRLEGSGED